MDTKEYIKRIMEENNAKLIQYIFDQIEIKYNIKPVDIDPQEIEDAIQEDKSWTEEE